MPGCSWNSAPCTSLQPPSVQVSFVQYSTVQYCTVDNSTVRYGTVQYYIAGFTTGSDQGQYSRQMMEELYLTLYKAGVSAPVTIPLRAALASRLVMGTEIIYHALSLPD